LSQFLAIQEKGVSAWKFEPELEIANCFVEARTEIEFFDSICSVQSNLPVPKQNEVYYWESKIYEKAENTEIAIGMTTKPYPLFRLPGKGNVLSVHVGSSDLFEKAITKHQSHIPRTEIVASINLFIRFLRMDRHICEAMLLVSVTGQGLAQFSSHGMAKS